MYPLVRLEKVSLDYPIYNSSALSFKRKILSGVTGGLIKEDPIDKIIVVNALKDISLTINKGDRLGLIGHNGSGKTSLLRLLSQIYYPTLGTLDVLGSSASLIDLSLGIDPEATGRENLYIRAAMLGVPRDQVEDVVQSAIKFSELGDFIELPFRTYSSGMQLRLAFSIATSIKPEILIMDEWLSAGDKSFAKSANERLCHLIDNSSALVLASHDINLISKTCNIVLWLEHGEIKMIDDVAVVLDQYRRSNC